VVSQLLLNGLIAGSVYALVAVSFSLIYRTVRFFHFAHGGIYTAGAYLCFTFYSLLRFPLFLAVICAVLLTAILGAGMDILIYRPMRARHVSSLVLLIVSLGLLIISQNIVSLVFGDATKTLRTFVAQAHDIGGARITSIQLIIVAVSVAVCALTWLLLQFSYFGRLMRAVANDSGLSRVVGVRNDRVIILVFALGSALAAGAAILVSFDTDMTPTMGFGALFMGVVAAIIGGVDSMPGAALGAVFVGLVQQLAAWKLPTEWQDAIVFVILIGFLVLRPQGLLGKRRIGAETI
jgi:branched-chain amino acid transport system permease protein